MLKLVEKLARETQANRMRRLSFDEPPLIRLVVEATRCPACQGSLRCYKTTEPRRVVTLTHGSFYSVEHLRCCAENGALCRPSTPAERPPSWASPGVVHSELLASLVPPKRRYGYDLVAHVGRRYFLDCRNEQELLEELGRPPYSLVLPRRSLGRLIEEFVWCVAAVHERATPTLRQLFAENGGYLLRVDGTCEADSPVRLLCQEAVTDIVLQADKLGSENRVEIAGALQRLRARFGDPVGTLADLRKEIRTVREELWPTVPHWFCHAHFLRDVGTDLLKPAHDALTTLFRQSRLSPALIEIRQYTGKRIRDALQAHPLRLDELLRQAQTGEADQLARTVRALLGGTAAAANPLEQLEREQLTMTILWLQTYASDGRGQGFPFDLPKLAYYRRCVALDRRLQHWLPAPLKSRQTRQFEKLRALLHPLVNGKAFRHTVQTLERAQVDFNRLRELLRICPLNGPGGVAREDVFLTPAELAQQEEETTAFRDELRERLQPHATATEVEQVSARVILQHLDNYWQGLFGHVLVTENGGLLVMDRTTNKLETLHRFGKRCRRRIHGRASVKHDLTRWPADVGLVSNLTNPLYVTTVYDSLDNLAPKFAEVFHMIPEIQAQSRPQQATVRLNPRQRKGHHLLDQIDAVRATIAALSPLPGQAGGWS